MLIFQEVRRLLVLAKDDKSPSEEDFFEAVDQKEMTYTDPKTSKLPPAEQLKFGLVAKRGRWPDKFDQLPTIKHEVFTCVIEELDDLYPPKGLECLFSVFDLRTFNKSDTREQKEKLRALCERFGKPSVQFSGMLLKYVRTEALFDPGEVFTEWFYVHPLLARLTTRAKVEKQVELYDEFLSAYGSMYTRVSELIRIMLVIASNSSLIEQTFSFLKGVKTPTRNALSVPQIERLISLSMNLPKDLSKVDIDSILSICNFIFRLCISW